MTSPPSPLFRLLMKAMKRERSRIRCPIISTQDEQIEDAVEAILDSYPFPGQMEVSRVDYAQPDARCAYIYLYLTSHLLVVSGSLGQVWTKDDVDGGKILDAWEANVRKGGRVSVCCVGGGPGTEVFALRRFLRQQQWWRRDAAIDSVVLDECADWSSAAQSIDDVLRTEAESGDEKIRYSRFDFFETLDADNRQIIENADLVTMVKFVSAVATNNPDIAQEKLQILLSFMKPGALLFFLDNSRGNCRQVMIDAINNAGFLTVNDVEHTFFQVSSDEIDAMKEKYKIRYGFYPQTTTHVTSILLQKT